MGTPFRVRASLAVFYGASSAYIQESTRIQNIGSVINMTRPDPFLSEYLLK
jgi:hypothetical protein